MSQQHMQGMAFEALVVEALIRDHKSLLTDESIPRLESRQQYYENITPAVFNKLEKQARRVSENLATFSPRYDWDITEDAVIDIVSDESGRSKVYDILVHTATREDPLELSIKTNHSAEDKSYRYNIENYTLDAAIEYTDSVLGNNPTGTWVEALSNAGLTVNKFHENVTTALMEALEDPNDPTTDMFARLTAERFVGDGGYMKTLSKGGIRWYPPSEGVPTIQNVQRLRPKVFQFDAVYQTNEGEVTYRLDFRTKFKDGQKKPVRFNAYGPANLAATIRILGIGDQPFDEIR